MLKYFLGVEVMRSKHGIFISQRKYVLDLLSETRKLGVKPCSSLMACYSIVELETSWQKETCILVELENFILFPI